MSPLPVDDCIRIQELEIHAFVGVTDEERAKPQRIVVNVTVCPRTSFDQMKDELSRTVNYVDVCRKISEFVETREYKLIETIASDLSSCLLSEFPLEAVEIEVRKFVLPNTAYVSVTTCRTRTG